MIEPIETENDKPKFEPDVIIDGRQYFYSPAQQLAKHICKQYDEYRLTCGCGFMSASIYFEQLIQKGGIFTAEKWGDKKCIGVLHYSLETNKIWLVKTNVNIQTHKFHKDDKWAMDECFGVQYEIFKYLRDADIIKICTVEKEGRCKKRYSYIITKLKAVRNGRFLHFKGHGTQFFIPKADFKKVENTEKPKRKRRKRNK